MAPPQRDARALVAAGHSPVCTVTLRSRRRRSCLAASAGAGTSRPRKLPCRRGTCGFYRKWRTETPWGLDQQALLQRGGWFAPDCGDETSPPLPRDVPSPHISGYGHNKKAPAVGGRQWIPNRSSSLNG
ncbi:hypothetical protein SBV1_2240012 [Verrucomicrobia bacterium]|nr:hypothetical protein SBV1_2240012 [Verrucomicrobiota bacterium]